MDLKKSVTWGLQILIAVIFLQTLFFKFTGASESIFIFSELGVEPWGRILSGIAELLAAVLLLIPGFAIYGALLAALLIVPALLAHFFILGIVVQSDGGLLFTLALIVLCSSLLILYARQKELKDLKYQLRRRPF